MSIGIDNLLRYEQYVPVMTDEEQKELLSLHPSPSRVREWDKRLKGHSTGAGEMFRLAYERQKKNNGERKR